MHKVKEDKKRVREMLAQDLPGKPRYPIFSAAAGLCCSLDVETVNQLAEGATYGGTTAVVTTQPVATLPVLALNAAHSFSTYTGQGAYIDGPACFVDLEANRRPNEKKGRQRRERIMGEEERQQLASASPVSLTTIPVALEAALERADISDLSDASGVREESADNSADQTNPYDVELSEETSYSYDSSKEDSKEGTTGSYLSYSHGEPSDGGDVIYSLSSNGGSRSSGDERLT